MDKINTFECLCCGRPVENKDEICEDCHIGCVDYDESGRYSVGDKITHKNFGAGIITEIKSYGSPVAMVDFETIGIKRLALEFAPIEKIA